MLKTLKEDGVTIVVSNGYIIQKGGEPQKYNYKLVQEKRQQRNKSHRGR